MRSVFERARSRRVLVIVLALALLPVSAWRPAVAGTDAPDWAPALGSRIADVIDLPVATQATAELLPGSDAVDRVELGAIHEALTPGYRAAGITRAGDDVAVSLLYMPESSAFGVIVAVRGELDGAQLTLRPGATVIGHLRDVGDSFELTQVDGTTTSFAADDPYRCAFQAMTAIALLVACTFGPIGLAIFCGFTSIDFLIAEAVLTGAACRDVPFDVSPNSQTVARAQRAHFVLKGSDHFYTDREITIPFETCSGDGCSTSWRVYDAYGESNHWFYPLISQGEPVTKTVYGTVMYDQPWGWRSEGVQLTVYYQ